MGPQTVQSTIDNTTTSITNSIESVQRFQQNIKVMTGLEPPPPPPPPPPKSGKEIAKEIALDVTGAVVKTAGKSAWYISKKTVALGIYGIKLAWKSGQNFADNKETNIETESVRKAAFMSKGIVGLSKETESDQASLEKEISDALKLAEEALSTMDVAQERILEEKEEKEQILMEEIVEEPTLELVEEPTSKKLEELEKGEEPTS